MCQPSSLLKQKPPCARPRLLRLVDSPSFIGLETLGATALVGDLLPGVIGFTDFAGVLITTGVLGIGPAALPVGLFSTSLRDGLGARGAAGVLRSSSLNGLGDAFATFISGLNNIGFERGMGVDLGRTTTLYRAIFGAFSMLDARTVFVGAVLTSGGVEGGVGSCLTTLVCDDGTGGAAFFLLTTSVDALTLVT
ncbi:hypothetical protein BC629DRAFT_973865 [Irpex lacteus]|nr:hypothetical protein BC629DRAFT_973865 [Irpex lacteus]